MLLILFLRVAFIQVAEGEYYKKISKQRTIKNDTIYANRGNIYATNGDLLATSMSKYTVRLDMVTMSRNRKFESSIDALCDSLSLLFGKTSSYYEDMLRSAAKKKNRYKLLARDLGYIDYSRLRSFPILNQGQYRSGVITEQKMVRARPLGEMAVRTVGYHDYRGPVGIEGAYIDYLKEHHGLRKKQKIAKGQWKPINDDNELEPVDGSDVITTIDVDIQDIAHHALLGQLQKFQADHGCVVVMETETGKIKAIANLGRASNGSYFEKRNYAVYEAHEPGSTFKLASLMVALEDKVIDTGAIINTEKGLMKVYGQRVEDSHKGGYGKISLARVIEVSSNVGVVKMVQKAYKKQPQKFVDGIHNIGFGKKIGLPIKGEGLPYIPDPKYKKKGDKKSWNGLSLPWMSWGYGVKITPLQMLTFYNAIANDGVMVKPRFIQELRNEGAIEQEFETEVLKEQIASQETIDKLKVILENVVKRGTATNIYSENFSMAGKTGTCQTDYWTGNKQYISSFAGFFPADNPKYSCIVVVHKPNKYKGFYGSTVAAPVFKAVAQKIYSEVVIEESIKDEEPLLAKVDVSRKKYQKELLREDNVMPDVRGLPVMDAVSVLENKGLEVRTNKTGFVRLQSVRYGQKVRKGQIVVLN